jgi:diguanylate cyclase (GGDEF)-like protein
MGILEESERQFELVRKAMRIFRARYPEAAKSTEFGDLSQYTTLFFGDIRQDMEELKKLANIDKIENILKELQKLRELVRVDPVTKLGNRRRYNEDILYQAELSVRYGHPFTLIRADIDDFRNVNNVYGHKAGDMVLYKLGDVLKKSTRHTDKIYRLGDASDEFAVILPETEITEGERVAEKIRDATNAEMYEFKNHKFGPVTFSQGLDMYMPKGESADYNVIAMGLDESADDAADQAKREGKNRICVYKSESGKSWS